MQLWWRGGRGRNQGLSEVTSWGHRCQLPFEGHEWVTAGCLVSSGRELNRFPAPCSPGVRDTERTVLATDGQKPAQLGFSYWVEDFAGYFANSQDVSPASQALGEGEGPWGNGEGPEVPRHCVLIAEKHFLPLAMLGAKI